MAHEFTKYHKLGGAYHWDPAKAGPDYMAHADRVARWITEDPVLDIGGGDGYICSLIRRTGKKCLIVDNLPYAIELAHENGQAAVLGDIMDLPKIVTKERWGAIYLGDIIEHLDDPERAIQAITGLTNVIYIATPPAKPGEEFHSQYHTMEFTAASLEKFMLDLGWQCTKITVKNFRIFARFQRIFI